MKFNRTMFFIVDMHMVIRIEYIALMTWKIGRWARKLIPMKVFFIGSYMVIWRKMTLMIKRMNQEISPLMQASHARNVAGSLDFWESMSLWSSLQAIHRSNWLCSVPCRIAKKLWKKSEMCLATDQKSHSHYAFVTPLDVGESVDSAVTST